MMRQTVCFLSVLKDLVPQYVGFNEDKHTHKSLCCLGARWLMRNHKCRSVLVERGSFCAEMPDVIGFYADRSYVIEAKTSRSDFLADAKKPHRIDGGMGQFRYFICPKGLISPDEVPDGWGLLYVSEKGMIKLIKQSEQFITRDKDSEFLMLTSALSCPWKMFSHWTEGTLKRLGHINWISVNTEIDLKLFAARIAVEREEEMTEQQKTAEPCLSAIEFIDDILSGNPIGGVIYGINISRHQLESIREHLSKLSGGV